MIPIPWPGNKFIQLPKASNQRVSLPKPFRGNNDIEKIERVKSEGPKKNLNPPEIPLSDTNDSY